jgi:signal peptidase complex subunit 3
MYSFWTRAHNTFFFWTSCLMGLAVACTLLTLFVCDQTVAIEGVKVLFGEQAVTKLSYYPSHKVDVAELGAFKVQANLTRLFHWNTKQVFLWVTAEYATKNHEFNQVILWDKIVEFHHDKMLKVRVPKSKYAFVEHDALFKGVTVNVSLEWELFPYVGALQQGKVLASTFTLPARYST